MSENSREIREVNIERLEARKYKATSLESGASLEFGQGEGLLTPVELLLAAIAGCSSIDVDVATTRRSEPEKFEVKASGYKVTEDSASRMEDIHLGFDLKFPDTEEGRKAAGMIQRIVKLSHDKYCTVSRTVELGAVVQSEVID
ncbi:MULTISPECIES: OsmC family protein [Glutamicibacter]|uniref:OsmC-like protein n=1 Tax=Glutamicibacter arilaitensis (strain DSM 16368 / CIP 108037 / IAM 15318 / JCM 13566 / NCIMB 14258 / Re117) TaxID=861360 RepID=A0ABP1U3A7_GLUAR|nr:MULTISPECIES: OsmC family protein [Glutamicibacter]CBT76410.1 OsmC-like protein [Glutamicibacter arilaitensis Re117]HCH47720.1 oxidoreductase [Glutamicibacter sp.]HCM95632.1 oxidoreductase [Glutamicibacter sp.]